MTDDTTTTDREEAARAAIRPCIMTWAARMESRMCMGDERGFTLTTVSVNDLTSRALDNARRYVNDTADVTDAVDACNLLMLTEAYIAETDIAPAINPKAAETHSIRDCLFAEGVCDICDGCLILADIEEGKRKDATIERLTLALTDVNEWLQRTGRGGTAHQRNLEAALNEATDEAAHDAVEAMKDGA
jgi:hypothetical protein